MVTVRQKIKLQEGEWLVSYVTLASCGCRWVRETIKVIAKKEPTQKQIENAISSK